MTKRNALEWTILAVSGALVVATLGTLVYELATSTTPRLSCASRPPPSQSGNGWEVR